ncbi:acyl-CoA desaturase, partial [Tsukamurella sputi]
NELGHNIMHGQWDWMNDPEIHSTTWEWDSACDSSFWRHTHNYMHHKYTNVTDLDDDIGYGILRVTRDQPWEPYMLFNPVYNVILMLGFQYGKAVQHLELMNALKAALNGGAQYREHDWPEFRNRLKVVLTKIAKQTAKDYVLFPAMAVPIAGSAGFRRSALANMTANTVRNVWDHVTI